MSESEIRHTGRHELEAEAEDRALARRDARRRVHWIAGEHAYCDKRLVGNDYIGTEDPDDVTCKRCMRKRHDWRF